MYSSDILSIIIPFLNEGVEVRNTLNSIRKIDKSITIIFINDASNDDYSYEFLKREKNVIYILNSKRIGVASCRELGIKICKTANFLLLDSHIRLYDNNIFIRINDILKDNNDRVLCFKNLALKIENEQIKEFGVYGYGSFFMLYNEKYDALFSTVWNTKDPNESVNENYVGCILGGAYASSKLFWNKINGLVGLVEYGSDEILISFKTWLAGGECLIVKDIQIGHIYRSEFPYDINNINTLYNILYISHLLLPPKYNIITQIIAEDVYEDTYANSMILLNENYDSILSHKNKLKPILINDYKIIEKMNDLQSLEFCNTVKFEKLQLIYKSLKLSSEYKLYGTLDGTLGCTIFSLLYEKYVTGNTDISVEIDCDTILSQALSLDFFQGHLGIGWALVYLYQHDLIKLEKFIKVIFEIDNFILNMNFEVLNQIAITNILNYLIARHYLPINNEKLFDIINTLYSKIVKNLNFIKQNNVISDYKIEIILLKDMLRLPLSFSDIIKIDDINREINIKSNSLKQGLTYIGICTLISELDTLI